MHPLLPHKTCTLLAIVMVVASSSAFAFAQTPATPASAPATSAPAPSSVPQEFEPFGLHLTPPADWKRLPEGQSQVVARWAVLKPGSTDQAAAVVTVEMQTARGRTAEKYGKELAQSLKGQADPAAELAGAKACRVTADIGDAKAPRPMEALIACPDQNLYIISAAATEPGVAHTQAIQDFRGGVEFVPVTSPTSYLEPRGGDPLTVLSRFRIKPMATLRPSPEQRPGVIQLRTMNYRRNRPDLLVTMEVLNVSTPNASLEAVGNEIVKRAGAPNVTMNWKEIPGPAGAPRRVVSNTFSIPGKPLPLRIGLVQLTPTDFAMVNFGLATPDDFDRVLYQDKCDVMLQSIEPVTGAPATAPSPAAASPTSVAP